MQIVQYKLNIRARTVPNHTACLQAERCHFRDNSVKKLDGKIVKNTSCLTLVRLRSFYLGVGFVELEYIG